MTPDSDCMTGITGGVYRPKFRAQIIIGPSVNLGIYVCWNWTFIRVEPLSCALGPSITLVEWGNKIHVWGLSQSLIQALPGVDVNCSTQFFNHLANGSMAMNLNPD